MSDLEKLVKVSRFFGCNPEFILAGGGNTSVKIGDVLYIKPSGISLKDIKKGDFIAIERKKMRETFQKRYDPDPFKREEQVKKDLLDARLDFKPSWHGPRASVEAGMHEIIDYKFVVHTHPTLINGLTCAKNGKKVADELFGKDYLWINSIDPGYTLSKVIHNKLRSYKKRSKGKIPNIILIQNHGLIVSGDTIDDIFITTKNAIDKINNYIKKNSRQIKSVFIYDESKKLSKSEVSSLLKIVSPILRGLLSSDLRKIIVFDDSKEVQKVICNSNGRQLVTGGSFSPDHIVYCREKALWIDTNSKNNLENGLKMELERYKKFNRVDPKIAFIQGVGMLAIGDSYNEAIIARDVYRDFIKVMEKTAVFGGPRFMTKSKANFIEKWEVESYRRKLIQESSRGRVQNKVAIVTGAGQGIGEGIAKGLAKEGAYVCVVDLNFKLALQVAENINQQYGSGRAFPIKVDVTNSEEIKKMVDETIRIYGGVDILVNNAGILISGPTNILTDEQLDIMTRVNYQAFFKVVRESVDVMRRQSAFNPDYLSDIILISSKSGLQGSPANALYAGSKFGGIGLMQSFAYEFIKYGIKVNAICPGNYFEGPLWSNPKNGLFVQYFKAGKVSGAKTIEDVKRYYESKCPMNRGVNLDDINKAIIYAVEQKYETGQAIPVTGGQVMLK